MSQEWIFELDDAPSVIAYARESPGHKTYAVLEAEKRLTHLLTRACMEALKSLRDSDGVVEVVVDTRMALLETIEEDAR